MVKMTQYRIVSFIDSADCATCVTETKDLIKINKTYVCKSLSIKKLFDKSQSV